MFTNQKRRRKAEKTQNTTSEIDRKENDKIVKKDILVSIQQIIPSLLSPLLRYLSNNGK